MNAVDELKEQLAAAQLQIKTLREALEASKIAVTKAHYGCANVAARALCNEARQIARISLVNLDAALAEIEEALSTPQDLSALHAYSKRIADAVEKLTVEQCAAKCKKEVVQVVLDSSDERAYNCAVADCVDTIRAMPIGQIDIAALAAFKGEQE